jgi:hypothetical protein
MTDEQILRLICDHTGKRINLPNFTLDELKDFARAVLATYGAAQETLPEPIDWAAHPESILPLLR